MAKSRLSHVCKEENLRFYPKAAPLAEIPDEHVSEIVMKQVSPRISRSAAPRRYTQLSELEQYKLLVQTATSYRGWQLVSVQNQADTNVLIGWLVPIHHKGDPSALIVRGNAMSILVDAMGEMKINQPTLSTSHRSLGDWLRGLIPFTTRN